MGDKNLLEERVCTLGAIPAAFFRRMNNVLLQTRELKRAQKLNWAREAQL
jgi:hypothetical protein